MRIQHNIMAMNAYNQYNKNTKALSANLEKLSSGYRINRAGDDAAGLAISEKMRAQITGLDAAQNNVKDGISLVKTAEGAMQEIHDMLNKMTSLATQSANGTYQDEVDRENLQKEIESIKSEINRIADSANFNGIKLLDGTLDTSGALTTTSGNGRIPPEWDGTGTPATETGKYTFLDGAEATEAVKTVFEMDFSDLKEATGGAATAGFVAGTTTTGLDSTSEATGLDFSGAGTFANAGQISMITGVTALNVGGVTVNLSGLTLNVGDTYASALTQIQAAVDTAVNAANATGAAGTANYNKIENATVVADSTAGFKVTYDQTPQTYTAPGGGITVDVDLGGATLATGVAINGGDSAAAIAQAVFDEIGGTTNSQTPLTGQNIFGNGTNYKVEIDGTKLKFSLEDDPTASNIKGNFTWDVDINGGKFAGNHTGGTNPTTPGSVESVGQRANTVFELTAADIKDGTVINLDGKKVTLSVGTNSKVTSGTNIVKLSDDEAADIDLALTKIGAAFGGETDNFEVSVNSGNANGATDVKKGLAVYKKATSKKTYSKMEDLENVFSISTRGEASGKALTLQIGDTADEYNRMSVSVGDMHTEALGIDGIDIGTQDGAAAAIQTIKDAINQVSSVRGDLGAIQNRLDHTGNNLAVMEENIQDAESTIRDTDVAEEMMSYVKNNILVQSAQAMLAQANQVPQGVLQLLG